MLHKIIIEKILKNKGVGFLLLAIIGFVKLLNRKDVYVFLGNIDQRTIFGALCILILVFAFFWVRPRRIYYFILFLLLLGSVSFTCWSYQKSQEEIFIFHSPNERNTILIRDRNSQSYYYKEGALRYKRLKLDWAGRSPHPFINDDYSIHWVSDQVVEIWYLLHGDSFYFYTILDLNHIDRIFEGKVFQVKNGDVIDRTIKLGE